MAAVAPTPVTTLAGAVAAPSAPMRPAGFVKRLFRDKPLGAVGGVVMVLFVFIGVFAALLVCVSFVRSMYSLTTSPTVCRRRRWLGESADMRLILSRGRGAAVRPRQRWKITTRIASCGGLANRLGICPFPPDLALLFLGVKLGKGFAC